MSGISPSTLAASVAGMGFVAFAAGFVLGTPAASAKADRLADRPIVDPHAWEISAPQAPPPPRIEIADCSPWDVSDTAMEGVLDEMQRRGWRPPREVEEILADVDLARAWREDAAQVGAESQASIEVVSDTESARLWNDAETGAPLAPQPASLVGAN